MHNWWRTMFLVRHIFLYIMKKIFTLLLLFVSMSLSAQIFIWKDGKIICQCDEFDSYDSITVASVELKGIDTIIGRVNGAFSVAEEKRVYFSRGNLRYHVEENRWQFADRQYNMVGFANSKIGFEEVGWIDLFGWGLSGYNGKNPNLTKLYPSDYADLMSGIAGTQYDCGVHNSIENGGNQPGLWRLLTKDEWIYLINKRPNAQNLYSHASVNGVPGIVLLPDNFVLPEGEEIYFTPNAGNYGINTYTISEWVKMQERGAVFLPASGYRIGTNISNMGSYGSYWSASVCNSGPYYFDFTPKDLYACYFINFSYAFSVRLVQDVK